MPAKGFFELYPEFRPILTAGPHMLATDHDLVAAPPQNDPGELAVDGSDFTFRIISPRYTMPPDQILSTFPPATAVGDWRERLPQIVFKRRTLPWEREPDHEHKFPAPQPPWMALVVLAEGEFSVSSAGIPVAQCVTPGTHLPDDTDVDTSAGRYLEVRQSIVDIIFPTVEDLRLLSHVRKVNLEDTELALGDDDGYLAVTIANRLPQPGPPKEPGGPATSMKYTACLINVESQLGLLPTKEETESSFEFTAVMAELVDTAYFAQPPDLPVDVLAMQGVNKYVTGGKAITSGAATQFAGGKAIGVEQAASAYATGPAIQQAVSANDVWAVNTWADGATLGVVGELYTGGILQIDPRVRFPLLASWEFVCTGDGGFERLMNALDGGLLGTDEISVDPRLRADLPPIPPELQPEVAETGHIGLGHTNRQGETARSWFRGPLVPQPTERTKPSPVDGSLPLAHTGDQLRRVVPDGREDVGLAAAFEIGRLLTLSQQGLVGAMISWREELFGASRVHQLGRQFFDGIVGGFSTALINGRDALEALVANTMIVGYADQIATVFGEPAKRFPVSRRPEVMEKATSSSVLGGMGLDAGEVQSSTKEFGIAGLSRFAVATADLPDTPVSKSKDLEGLRGDLDAHLDSIAMEAMKTGRTDGGGVAKKAAAPARRAAPRRDALDRMIDQAKRNHADRSPR